MKILVFNCGSSSIKYKLFDMPARTVLAKGMVSRIGEEKARASQETAKGEISRESAVADHHAGLAIVREMLTNPQHGVLASMDDVEACGHRVVHGGEAASGSLVIDAALEKTIDDYADLAPLHNPPNLSGIREARKMMPKILQVACFDTAFHQSLPETAFLYAIPRSFYEQHAIRKYGFHGTSHSYVALRAADILGKRLETTNLITCHLGNGCSMAAIKNGKCVDTSMGLTPLEGLMMGTRSGDMDPAIILYLLRHGHSVDDIDEMLNRESGLLGVSGVSNDVRDLERAAGQGDKDASVALNMFAYRIRKYLGAYLAVLGRCDAIVLTGGIGENESAMRARIFSGLENLGIEMDGERNSRVSDEDMGIHAANSCIQLLVIPTDEEVAIAEETYNIRKEKR